MPLSKLRYLWYQHYRLHLYTMSQHSEASCGSVQYHLDPMSTYVFLFFLSPLFRFQYIYPMWDFAYLLLYIPLLQLSLCDRIQLLHHYQMEYHTFFHLPDSHQFYKKRNHLDLQYHLSLRIHPDMLLNIPEFCNLRSTQYPEDPHTNLTTSLYSILLLYHLEPLLQLLLLHPNDLLYKSLLPRLPL